LTQDRRIHSNVCFEGFLHRKKYTLRRKTTTERDLPKDFLEKINQFHQDCVLNFIDDVELDPNTLKNMDGTSIYLDILNLNRLLMSEIYHFYEKNFFCRK